MSILNLLARLPTEITEQIIFVFLIQSETINNDTERNMKVDRSDGCILKFLAPKVRGKMGYAVNRNGFLEHKGR